MIFACDRASNPYLWLYSPNGNCQYNIGPLDRLVPSLSKAVLTLIGQKILACGALNSPGCYLYDINLKTWSLFATTTMGHSTRGVAHHGKIYLPDDTKPEVIDIATKTVSTWAIAPSSSEYACFVSWNNYILKFGSNTSPMTRSVYKYNPSNNTWTTLPGTSPMDLYNSGCTTMPNNNVLITGSGYDGAFFQAYAEFNVTSNTWFPLIYGQIHLYASTPVVLGNRVFVIPPNGPAAVEEYIISNRTISFRAPNIQFTTSYPATVAVPADWFSSLPGGCKGVY